MVFGGLHLLFLPNVPGAMFIQGGTFIPDSRVLIRYILHTYSQFMVLKSTLYGAKAQLYSEILHLCLVLLQIAKCFVPIQMFYVRPKIYLHILPVTNFLCQTKRWFAFSKIFFCACTKVFEEALNAVKFLGWLKIFGPAQNILGPVKGQGIS